MFDKTWDDLKEMQCKAPSNICGGFKQCVDRQGNFEDPFCKECADDYDAAMAYIPTQEEQEYYDWYYETYIKAY